MALSGLPRAFEIFDETLGGEVKAELEAFAKSKSKREPVGSIRYNRRCIATASLHGDGISPAAWGTKWAIRSTTPQLCEFERITRWLSSC